MDKSKAPMQDRFQHLKTVMEGSRFLQKQGLGNEVPFFICPFSPGEAIEMEQTRRQLMKSLNTQGIQVLEINLYDLSIDLLQERGIWQQILEMEPSLAKDELKELLQGVLDPETHLIPAISTRIQAYTHDILFISGIGEVFPFIRSHNVLNNLQSTAKEQPTVMFFPGVYTHSLENGSSLDLFGKLHDDRYYRAFNIYDYEV